jgi:hypothetical protein
MARFVRSMVEERNANVSSAFEPALGGAILCRRDRRVTAYCVEKPLNYALLSGV